MGISVPTTPGGTANVLQVARATATTNQALSGTPTIDDIALSATNRVLLTGQSSASENGLWVAAAGAWARPSDYAAGATIQPNVVVPVAEGTTNGDTRWQITDDGTVIVDTDPTTWGKTNLGLVAVVDDLSPRLGGDLDVNSKAITGPVGIGTALPARPLDVIHATDPQLRLTQAAGAKFTDLEADSTGRLNVRSQTIESLVVRSSHINNSVYITGGDTSYNKALNGSAGPTLAVGVKDTAGTGHLMMYGGPLGLGVGGVPDAITIDATSDVGIGTAAPDRKLDVLDSAGVSDAAVPQLRLTHTDGVNFAEVGSTADGYFLAQPSGGAGYNFFRGSGNSYIVIQDPSITKELTPASFPDTAIGMRIGIQAKVCYMWLTPEASLAGAAIKIGVDHSTLVIDDAGGTKNVQVVGNATLGATDSDVHTLNGTLNLNSEPADETCSGTTATFQAGEGLNRGDVVYFKPADSKMYKADADLPATSRAVAIAAENIVLDDTGRFLLQGFVKDVGTFAGAYTAGDVLYTHTTGGPPNRVAPSGTGDSVQVIGWAVDTNTIYFDPSSTIIEIA